MRTKLINKNKENNRGYGAGSGDTEKYEYYCPCGKGKIIEEHDNIPGFREHAVWIQCEHCNEKYELNTSSGVRQWEIIKK